MEGENSYDLGNNRFFRVTEWKSEPRFDLRQFETQNEMVLPTKKGVSIPLQPFKNLIMEIDNIDNAWKNKQTYKTNLGEDIFCVIENDSVCV